MNTLEKFLAIFLGMFMGFIITLALVDYNKVPVLSIPKYQKIRKFEQEHGVTLTVDSQGKTWLWIPKIQKSVEINVEGNVVF